MSPKARPSRSRTSRGVSGGNATKMSISVPVRWTPFATEPTRSGFAWSPFAAIRGSGVRRVSRATSRMRRSSAAEGRIFRRIRASNGCIRARIRWAYLETRLHGLAVDRVAEYWPLAEQSLQCRGSDYPIDDELHSDRGQKEPHHAADRPRPGSPDFPEDAIRVVQQKEGGQDGEHDPGENGQLVHGIGNRRGHVDHDRRDRSRSRKERDANGDDRDLVTLRGLLSLLRGEPGARPLPVEHLEGDAEQEDAASDLERGDREAETREDPLPEHAEGDVAVRHAFDTMFCFSVGSM